MSPASVTLGRFGNVRLVPTLLDSRGQSVAGATFQFRSGDSTIARVTTDGVVSSVGPAGAVQVEVRSSTLTREVPVQVLAPGHPAGAVVRRLRHPGVYTAAIAASGTYFVSGPNIRVARGSLAQPDSSLVVLPDIPGGFAIGMNSTGTTAYFGSQDLLIEADAATGVVRRRVVGEWREMYDLVVSPDDRVLYASVNGGRILALNTASLDTLWTLRPFQLPRAFHLAIAPREPFLYASGSDFGASLRIDVRDRTVVSLPGGGTGRLPQAIQVSLDGRQILRADESAVVGGSGGVDIMDATDPAMLTRVAVPNCGPWGLMQTPDAAHLYVTCPQAPRLRVLALSNRSLLPDISVHLGVQRIAVAFDGLAAVAAGGDSVVIIR